MTGHPETRPPAQSASQTVSMDPTPAAADKPRRRRCDNCGAFFPLTRTNRRFCNKHCKDEFHNFGAAYGPLKVTLTKLVEKLTREALKPEAMIKAGFFHRSKFKHVPAAQTGAHLRDDLTELAEKHNGLLSRVRSLENPPTEESPGALRRYLDTLAGLIGGLDKRLAVVEMTQRVLANEKNSRAAAKPSKHHHRRGQAEKKPERRAR